MTVATSESSVTQSSSSNLAQSSETSEIIQTSSRSETSSCVTMTSTEETAGDQMRRSNSKDLILDLVPAPVECISVGVKEETVALENKVKSKKAVKKERSQTTLISDVLAKEKTEANKKSLKAGETPAGDKKCSVRSDSSLQSTNLIKAAASKKSEKKGSRTNGALNTNNSSNGSIKNSKSARNDGKSLRSRSLSQEKQVNGNSEPNKTKKVPSERKQGSRVRQKTPQKDEMLFNNMNGENKENGVPTKPVTVSNVRGGFLAPTKSWLLYMGNQVDLKSRSPSPSLNIKERSPSPRRRMRESSSESDTKSHQDKARKSSVGPGQRKVVEKDPNLPIVKRSNSVKKKSAINGDLKGKDSTKKAVSNGVDGDGRSAHYVTQPTATDKHKSATNGRLKKEASASKLDSKQAAKTMSDTKTPINVKDGSEIDSKNKQKKGSQPPVAPKPVTNGSSSLKQETDAVTAIKSASSAVSSSSASDKTSSASSSAVLSVSEPADSSCVTQGSSIMQMSNCSNLAATSATAATATTTTTAEASGIEETSLRASEVIQKFETASKSSSELNILSSHLMQDTVSSRLKKISAEEFSAMERKASTSKTGEERRYI